MNKDESEQNKTLALESLAPDELDILKNQKIKRPARVELNRMFKNIIVSFFDSRWSIKNMKTSKEQFSQKYGIPHDSKIYNYGPSDMMRFAELMKYNFSPEHDQEKKDIQNRLSRRRNVLGSIGVLGIVNLINSKRYIWSKLTSGTRLHYLTLYCCLAHIYNFALM